MRTSAVALATCRSIIDAAIRLYSQAPTKEPTINNLAQEAGVSETTIQKAFGGVAGAAVAACAEWIPEFEVGIDGDLRSEPKVKVVEVLQKTPRASRRKVHRPLRTH